MVALDKARKKLAKETNIIEIIRSRRFFSYALKQLIPKPELLSLRKKFKYLTIDPEAPTSEKETDYS